MFTDEHFTYLADKYMDTIFRLAFSYMKSRPDADDITQNVLLKLYRTNTDFQSESHLKNWLIRVTINECKQAFRSPWRRTEDIEDYANTLALPSEEHHDLFRTVMSLPPKYRVVLYLHYYEDHTSDEIARMLDIPAATVRTRLARGREKLKKVLTEAYAL